MDFAGIVSRLSEVCPGSVAEKVDVSAAAKDPFVVVPADKLQEAMKALEADGDLAFDLLISISAVDYPEVQLKAKKKDEPPPPPIPGRFELVYHLLSTVHNHRLVAKVKLPHTDKPVAPTVSAIYATADWHERECWDLMGIHFEGHPDLRRVLCALDWVGHPLRKDYVFPKEYHGISCE